MKYKFYTRIIEIPDNITPPTRFTDKFPPLIEEELLYLETHPNSTINELNSINNEQLQKRDDS